jgi:hypothetical protein
LYQWKWEDKEGNKYTIYPVGETTGIFQLGMVHLSAVSLSFSILLRSHRQMFRKHVKNTIHFFKVESNIKDAFFNIH